MRCYEAVCGGGVGRGTVGRGAGGQGVGGERTAVVAVGCGRRCGAASRGWLPNCGISCWNLAGEGALAMLVAGVYISMMGSPMWSPRRSWIVVLLCCWRRLLR